MSSPPPPAEDDKTSQSKAAPTSATRPPQTIADTTVVFMICCGNFANAVLTISIISYFFWTGVAYIVGATIMATGWGYYAIVLNDSYVCGATQHVFTLMGLWYFQGASFLLSCWGYSSIEAEQVDEFEYLTAFMKVMGFFVKSFPTWIRLLHLFNYCQISVILLDLLILPECNFSAGRWTLAAVIMLWWFIIMFGVYAKRRIFMPPFLYDPLRPGSGLVREIHKLLRGFGP
eukprot:GHVQ01003059.1.p1 GENE.GHVQ01003059.1~~GHVQ01003059.1.p1  ORF type:complete len:231 (-),score=25.69 GHVQ01003059.1:631-1323(-)